MDFFYVDLHFVFPASRGPGPLLAGNISLLNTLVCINIKVSISSSLKFLKAGKGKAIYYITNKDIRGFFCWLYLRKSCPFVSNKEIRGSASTETTSLVINAYLIAQFRHIKIQLKTIDVTTRLGGMI